MICNNCQKEYHNKNCVYDSSRTEHSFCCLKCSSAFKSKSRSITKPCTLCGKLVKRVLYEYSKSRNGNIFCNHSCAVSYHNTQRRKSRRSKCEILLAKLLHDKFPKLQILESDKSMLDGYEIDIAIPELKLGIEWNGIVHYKPIFGQTKLSSIQKRDAEKQIKAASEGIDLIIVPDLVSTEVKVRAAFSYITKIIEHLLANKTEEEGVEPTRSFPT